jgi:hypothetical protein
MFSPLETTFKIFINAAYNQPGAAYHWLPETIVYWLLFLPTLPSSTKITTTGKATNASMNRNPKPIMV